MILFPWSLVMTYHYWISKLLLQKLWLVDTVSVKDRSSPVDQASEEPSMPREVPIHMPKFQLKRMRCHHCKNEAQIPSLLCPVRHVACTYAWQKRETGFWSIICSFPSRFHCLYIYILENKLFLCRLFRFFLSYLPCLLCSRICLRIILISVKNV